MIEQDYCKKGMMRPLLEKGYPLRKVHVVDSPYIWYVRSVADPEWHDCDAYYRPTMAQVQKWLREEHLVHVYAEHKAFFQERPKRSYCHWMPRIKTLPHCKLEGVVKDTVELDIYCDTYEQAVAEGLFYVLNELL